MDSRITTNQRGTTVRFRYPRPNGRNDPSELYKSTGFMKFTKVNNITKSAIAIVNRFI